MAVAFILLTALILVKLLVVFDYENKSKGLLLDLVGERYAVAFAPFSYACAELVAPASDSIARLNSGTDGSTLRYRHYVIANRESVDGIRLRYDILSVYVEMQQLPGLFTV